MNFEAAARRAADAIRTRGAVGRALVVPAVLAASSAWGEAEPSIVTTTVGEVTLTVTTRPALAPDLSLRPAQRPDAAFDPSSALAVQAVRPLPVPDADANAVPVRPATTDRAPRIAATAPALRTTSSSMGPAALPVVARPAVSALAPGASARPGLRPRVIVPEEMPDLRWDHVQGSARWTRAAMRALDVHGDRLVDTVPRDIESWCPAYPHADRWSRKAFWAGLLSTLTKHESTYDPRAVGGGGLWYGLVQILPATARGYGCRARTGEALKDGALNMSCAVRIMNVTVPRDQVVSRGWRGVAADWGPFHSARKREDMRRWLSRQSFCLGLHASARPVPRPGFLGTPAGEAEEVPLFVSWELDKEFLAAGPAAAADGIGALRAVPATGEVEIVGTSSALEPVAVRRPAGR